MTKEHYLYPGLFSVEPLYSTTHKTATLVLHVGNLYSDVGKFMLLWLMNVWTERIDRWLGRWLW